MARCKSLFAGLPGSKATRQGFTRFSGSSKLAFGRLQNPFRGARPQNLHMHMATRESKATRQGFMGLRSLRLAGFKTLFAGSRVKTFACTWLQGTLSYPAQATRQGFMGLRHLRLAGFKTLFAGPGLKTFTCTWPQGSQRPPGKVLWAFEACVWPASKPFRGVPASKPSRAPWLQGTLQGFMGLRSLRLAGFKTLFAGSRRQNLRVHMATRDPQATRQGFMGLRSLRLAAFKTLFAGSRPLNLRLHMATRQGFNGPASKAFSRGYPALRPPGKVLQGFMGLRNLRLAAFKTLFAGPGLKTFTCTWLQGSQRPPGKVLWAFEACVWPASKPFSRGPASKPLRAHGYKGLSATRLRPPGKVLWAFDTCVWPASKPFSRGPASKPSHAHGHKGVKGRRQGFMGLRSLRLAGFKTFSRGPGVKTFACTWLQGTLRPPGKVLWAFEACVWPPSKPFSRGPGL